MCRLKCFAGAAVLLVASLGVGAAQTQDAKPKPPDWKKKDRIVTVRGCLEQGKVADEFRLTARNAKGVGPENDPATLQPASVTLLVYTLSPNGKKLEQYLNQQVEVRGRIRSEGDLTLEILTTPAGAQPAPDPALNSGPQPDTEARLTVLSVKRVEKTCTP